MATFAKPENALKRAEELMNVGQKQAALQALHDLITSKRYRTWQKTLEKIMFKYVELCVDMKKGRFAKDGLIQYRIVCQQVNVSSLEEVIKYFLQLSSERAEQAQAQAAEVTLDIEDLEAEKRPEDLMMSYVSGEKGKERSDRELVTPWFKFLWETYRTVLEILRNNSKLESLYAMTAHRAFQFCLQYKRTTEFRRLCEILRNHLTNLNKYRDQRDRPDLTQPESLQLYLETRFEQLKIATELELWQEAFRSIEDIHGLMTMVKKTPKPQMMAIYYAKLTKIFWVADSHLYHAYAWYKLYNLQRSYNKNLTAKDLQLMASSVLLATLAVTPYDCKHGAHHFELEMEKDRNIRMANLLGFILDPKKDSREVLSRAALLSELVAKGLLTYVSQEVKDLYNLVENEFHPLDLAAKVQPHMLRLSKLSDKLSSASPVPEVQLEQYVPALEKLTTLRVLQQVSQVYQTMKISNLTNMIGFFDFSVVEKLTVDAVKYNFVQVKIDHLKGVVSFGSQDLESEKIKNHLTILAKRFNKAISMIQPPTHNRPSRQSQPFSELEVIVEKEHKKLLARKVLIERRKEEQERQMLEMEREEESKRLKQQRLTEEAEAKRLANESARREEARIRKEIEEKELEEARALLAEAEKRKGKKGKKATGDGEVTKLSKQSLMEEAFSEQMKERAEMERKLQKLSKTMDHLERAKREEERPLIEEAHQKRLQDDEKFYKDQQEQAIDHSQKQHETDLVEKNRLIHMLEDKNLFQQQAVSRREGEFERLRRLREERLAEERSLRSQEREVRRKKEYYRRQEEARLLKIREEEEARKLEEEERKRKEEADRRAKLEEIAAKQRQREIEAEEREKREREALQSKIEDKPGKFIPPSLRKRLESEEPRPTMETSNTNNEESKKGVLYDAQRLYDLGCGALRVEAYDEAADCLSKALEIRVQHYGELALECATTYYKYGCALFDRVQSESDPLGDKAEPKEFEEGPSSPGASKGKGFLHHSSKEDPADNEEGDEDGEGDGDQVEEEEGDLEDAWKMLEFARVIHEKHGCCTIETVDIITKLADINCFKEDYKTCFEDYSNALHILEGLVEPDSRILAELHFKIGLAHQLDLKPKEALGYCNNAVAICEARVQRLKEELAGAKSQQTRAELQGVPEASEKAGSLSVLKDESTTEGPEGNSELSAPADEVLPAKEDQEDIVVALEAEIKDIEESLLDLREKADELKEMATAPSLVEALQAANPEAVASLKQIVAAVSQASGSSNGGGNAPSSSDAFDAPSLGGASSSAVVTHLGVVGRGVKRAAPIAVSSDEVSRTTATQPKKRSLDDMMIGSGFGETQIGFGERSEGVANGSSVQIESKSVVTSTVQEDNNVGSGASNDKSQE
ncbi:unnamed protein product [Sphagnum jensenii]|uniref:Eukaryotic translation initiation factor 3 subunit A n=1 Tax=Sphagnum jensenii TaxID=128206 RepID=A0ABP0XA66_9BRYO